MVEKIIKEMIKEEKEEEAQNLKDYLSSQCCALYLHFVKGCYGKNDKRDAPHWRTSLLTSVRNLYSAISSKKKPDFVLIKTILIAKPVSKKSLTEVHSDFKDHESALYVWNKISKSSIDQEYIKFVENIEKAYTSRITSNDFTNAYVNTFQVPEV